VPIQPNPQQIAAWPHQANVPVTSGMFITVQVQGNGQNTVEELDATLQSLIDHLQTWPGRDPNANVTGGKYDTLLYLVSPTDPIDLPDPPDPEPETP
jgi:hypothetical protein